jgi:hypothetical protein
MRGIKGNFGSGACNQHYLEFSRGPFEDSRALYSASLLVRLSTLNRTLTFVLSGTEQIVDAHAEVEQVPRHDARRIVGIQAEAALSICSWDTSDSKAWNHGTDPGDHLN